MNYSLNSLKRVIAGIIQGTTIGVIEGHATSMTAGDCRELLDSKLHEKDLKTAGLTVREHFCVCDFYLASLSSKTPKGSLAAHFRSALEAEPGRQARRE